MTAPIGYYYPEGSDNPDLVRELFPEPEPDDLWWDLRPLEAARLAEIRRETIERALARAQAVIFDEVVAGGLQFGREFPDAPRAKVGVTA